MHEIYISRNISTGHRIVGHEGKCRFLHGHNYEVEVTLFAEALDDLGFVVDFGLVKAEIDKWDHKTVLWEQDPFVVCQELPLTGFPEDEGRTRLVEDPDSGIVRVPFNPTAESMAKDLADRFYQWDRILSATVSISETGSTEATYTAP